ncbi:MAG: hypothetical protein M3R51_11160 [Candidatus Eremiobacteraeota bacterium]|nr:hypothetical protein [Candidatus Eremiobacteraeota bacterium]
MNDDSNIIPLFGIIFLFGAPVAAWIVSRVLAHNERMEMIRRGFVPPPDPRIMRRAGKIDWQSGPPGPPDGSIPNVPPPGSGYYAQNYYAQAQMRKGITITAIGVALLIGLSFIGSRSDGSYAFGPWLLGGLVPMFVGVAQIINATLNGAHLPGMATQSAEHAAYGPQSGTAARNSAPYAGWRPGPTKEVESAPPPPDLRT